MRRLILVVLILAPSSWATADTSSVPDDPTDSGTTLDIAEVQHSHGGAGVLRHDITMTDPWTEEDFESIGAHIYLPDGDASEDRTLWIHVNEDGSFRGNFFGQRRLRGFANVYRIDDRTIRFELTKKLLSDEPLKRYSYKVQAMGTFECPPGVTCAPPPPDLAPDKGRIRHDLS
jgi:hypothetical protein